MIQKNLEVQSLAFLHSFHLLYLEVQLHSQLCICPQAIIDKISTTQCNMRVGEFGTPKKLQ